MSSSNLIRWGGLAAVMAGVLFVAADLLGLTLGDNFAEYAASGAFIVQQMLFLLGSVLLLGGLVGLYARQSEVAGVLGLVGFLVAFVGTALLVGALFAQSFVVSYLATEAPDLVGAGEQGLAAVGFGLAFIVFPLGWLLFGVASLRARVYPRMAAILLIIGAGLAFLTFLLPTPVIVLGVAIVWLGVTLWSERGASVGQPVGVR